MKNYLIYVTTAIVLSLLLIFILVLPNYNDLQKLNKEVFEKETTLQSQKEYFEELQNVADRLEGTEEEFEKIESSIPVGNNLANLMNYFQKAASRAGLVIANVSPAQVSSTKSKSIKTGQVNLVLSGDYEAFKSFLGIVEKSSRLIEIENIHFQSPREEKFQFNLSTRFRYK